MNNMSKQPSSDTFVSVVSPLHNDADIVEEFIEEIIGVLKSHYANYELVLVDDGSTDATVSAVVPMLKRHECIRLIRLSRNFGSEIAVAAGLDTVIGDFVVVMDPASDPPAAITEMVEMCRKGVGAVFGVKPRNDDAPFYLRHGRRLFYWFLDRALGIDIPHNSTGFNAFSRQTVNAIVSIKDRFRFLRSFSMHVGYGNTTMPYEPIRRRAERRHRGFLNALDLAVNMIATNSTRPLRFVGLMGLLLSMASFAYIGYVFLVYFFSDNIAAGWTTRSLHTSAMFMFLFMILAVMSEYIGRLLDEVKGRPLYYVVEERHSSVLIAHEDRKNVVTESVEE